MRQCSTILEIVGIPYSGKSVTTDEIERQLKGIGLNVYVIREFKGSDDFYRAKKLTPEINMLRAINSLHEIIHKANLVPVDVILIDRGIVDSHCWHKWFSGDHAPEGARSRLLQALFDVAKTYSKKYAVVWMDREPIDSLRSHGELDGKIVNYKNLSELRDCYEQEFKSPSYGAKYSRQAVKDPARRCASRIISELKITQIR